MKSLLEMNVGLISLMKREILRFLVVMHQTLIPPLISSLLFFLIFGLSVGKHMQFADLQMPYLHFIIPGIVTMYLISGSFENTSSSLFIARWHNHIQEVLLSPLSYFEMVLGLLTGGCTRGIIVAFGVYGISALISPVSIDHPFLLSFFLLTISMIFACGGLVAALWAKDFGMLSIWNTYIITPAVFLGGVFNPISMMPDVLQSLAAWNPMYYLISGMRYSILGVAEAPVMLSIIIALGFSVLMMTLTVDLFKIGYRLRS